MPGTPGIVPGAIPVRLPVAEQPQIVLDGKGVPAAPAASAGGRGSPGVPNGLSADLFSGRGRAVQKTYTGRAWAHDQLTVKTLKSAHGGIHMVGKFDMLAISTAFRVKTILTRESCNLQRPMFGWYQLLETLAPA